MLYLMVETTEHSFLCTVVEIIIIKMHKYLPLAQVKNS